uniref:Uncharacterized protein n=1 Tax=Anopheles atroparvus TaxID=41427 RepID=A0A182J5W6_ANOAO
LDDGRVPSRPVQGNAHVQPRVGCGSLRALRAGSAGPAHVRRCPAGSGATGGSPTSAAAGGATRVGRRSPSAPNRRRSPGPTAAITPHRRAALPGATSATHRVANANSIGENPPEIANSNRPALLSGLGLPLLRTSIARKTNAMEEFNRMQNPKKKDVPKGSFVGHKYKINFVG